MRQKRKLYKRIILWIKKLFGSSELRIKIVKGGCPKCKADLIVYEQVAVVCSDSDKIVEIDVSTGITKYKCDYRLMAG